MPVVQERASGVGMKGRMLTQVEVLASTLHWHGRSDFVATLMSFGQHYDQFSDMNYLPETYNQHLCHNLTGLQLAVTVRFKGRH